MQINEDFESFIQEVYFLEPSNKVLLTNSNTEFITTEEFKKIFPNLSITIEKSRKTPLTINDQQYILFAWNNVEGNIYLL